MKTEFRPRLFRYDQKLSAISVADPALTVLSEGDSYALLVAQSVHEDSGSSRLLLETVSVIPYGVRWSCREIAEVALLERDGVCLAEDTARHKILAPVSRIPLTIVFISREDYERLQTLKHQRAGGAIFAFARRFFKTVPKPSRSEGQEEVARWEDARAGDEFDRALMDWIVKHRSG